MTPLIKLCTSAPSALKRILPLACAICLLSSSHGETYVAAGGLIQSWAFLGWLDQTTGVCWGGTEHPCSIPLWAYDEKTITPSPMIGKSTAEATADGFDGFFSARTYLPAGLISIRGGGPGAYGAMDDCNCTWVSKQGHLDVEAYYQDVITLGGPFDSINPVPVKIRGRVFGHFNAVGGNLEGYLKVQATDPTYEVTIFDVDESDASNVGGFVEDFERVVLIYPRVFQTAPYQFAISAFASGWYPGQNQASLSLAAYVEIVLPPGVDFTSQSGSFLNETAEVGEFIVPKITWKSPLPIVEGTPLSATQLNATADLPGTFEYDPPIGTVLNPGFGHELRVHFTPILPSVIPTADKVILLDVLPATPSVITGPIGNPENLHNYYLLDQSTWNEAETAAQKLGGHLVTIRNEAEQDWVFQTFANFGDVARHLWIGLFDPDPVFNADNLEERRHEFQWSSGEPVLYTNWWENEPNNLGDAGEVWGHMFAPSFLDANNNAITSLAGFWNDAAGNGFGGAPLSGVVEVIPPPLITKQPQSQTVMAGEDATFTVEATGGLPLTYQWRLNGAGFKSNGSENPNVLVLRNLFGDESGTIDVVIWNAVGKMTSAPVQLTVLPAIVPNAGLDQTVFAGVNCFAAVTLNGSATTGAGLNFAWREGETLIGNGVTTQAYLRSGAHTVTLTVDDGLGHSASDSLLVVVQDTTPPIPKVPSLPVISGQCPISLSSPPEAIDNCAGTIIGTTNDPLIYTAPGTYIVTWSFNDGNGSIVTQPQTVTVLPLTVTTVTYNGSTSSLPGATILLSAGLQSGAGKKAAPLPGQLISFNLNNTTHTAVTDSTGTAKIFVQAPATAGSYVISATYAGACPYSPATNTKSLNVKKK